MRFTPPRRRCQRGASRLRTEPFKSPLAHPPHTPPYLRDGSARQTARQQSSRYVPTPLLRPQASRRPCCLRDLVRCRLIDRLRPSSCAATPRPRRRSLPAHVPHHGRRCSPAPCLSERSTLRGSRRHLKLVGELLLSVPRGSPAVQPVRTPTAWGGRNRRAAVALYLTRPLSLNQPPHSPAPFSLRGAATPCGPFSATARPALLFYMIECN